MIQNNHGEKTEKNTNDKCFGITNENFGNESMTLNDSKMIQKNHGEKTEKNTKTRKSLSNTCKTEIYNNIIKISFIFCVGC